MSIFNWKTTGQCWFLVINCLDERIAELSPPVQETELALEEPAPVEQTPDMAAPAAALTDADLRRALADMANAYVVFAAAMPAPGAAAPAPVPGAVPAAGRATTVVATVCNETAKPLPHNGSRAGYNTFRRNMLLHSVGVPGSNTCKVITTLSFMTAGDADRWAQAYFDREQATIDANGCVWRDFLAELDGYFHDPQQQEHAHQELCLMVLKTNETCEDLFMCYNQVCTEANLTAAHFDPEQIERLQRILPSVVVRDVQRGYDRHIKDQIGTVNMQEATGLINGANVTLMENAINAQCLTFDEFKREVIKSDRAFRCHLYEHKRFGPTYQSPYRTTQSTMRAGPSRYHDPMAVNRIDRVDAQGNREKHCDPAEKGCWDCGKDSDGRGCG